MKKDGNKWKKEWRLRIFLVYKPVKWLNKYLLPDFSGPFFKTEALAFYQNLSG